MAHEGRDEAPGRPADRSIWTSGRVGTPALIAFLLVAIYNLVEHRWTAAIIYGAAAVALLLGAVVSRRAQSR